MWLVIAMIRIIFPHKLLLINTQDLRLHKIFLNNWSANIKLSKTQLDKIEQSGGFLGRLLGPLLKNWLAFNEEYTWTIS